MASLDGSAATIELAPGYRLTAAGLRGTATAHDGRTAGTRGGTERATTALDEALARHDMNEIKLIELGVQSVAPPRGARSVRTSQGHDALVLDVPDLGPTVGQVVLAVDEEGVCTWNFPEAAAAGTATRRGAAATKRFVIRNHVPATPPDEAARQRGLVQLLGRKLLKVLVYPVTDRVLGPITEHFAARWEAEHRPPAIRSVTPDNYRAGGSPIDSSGWRSLAGERSLLFIHGTFATTHGGFGGLPKETVEALVAGYGGRVFAFDHSTISVTPADNIDWFTSQIPAGLELNLDVICHSRGGLVARSLAGELKGSELPGIRVGKVVLFGTPNQGTALADPDHMVAMIDRWTSLLNLFPPGPLSVVTEFLEAIVTVVKMVSHAALSGLSGLASMNPAGDFLAKINAGVSPAARYYAVTAEFEPKGSLRQLVRDELTDRVFGDAPNDLVVPTLGVFQAGNDPGFPIPPERTLRFGPEEGVTHSDFFSQPKTTTKLREWLLA